MMITLEGILAIAVSHKCLDINDAINVAATGIAHFVAVLRYREISGGVAST